MLGCSLRSLAPVPLTVAWRPCSASSPTSPLAAYPTTYIDIIVKMVCSRCQKASKSTTLATPNVKKKSEIYYGSPAGSSKSGDKSKTSATLGNNGIGKVSGAVLQAGCFTHVITEQVTVKGCAKSLCVILKLLHYMQDQDRSRPNLLPEVRVQGKL